VRMIACRTVLSCRLGCSPFFGPLQMGVFGNEP
jgi:hypothetical protein